ncbi:MAG: hypothetical protein BWX68_03046 [Verrucomicrobia bacterium ADurb.Bin063]|nr:MAG: hypothetical protein BWX68_03046 [Verrucomicrobia bacterium ADurb.Bin063]
MVGGREGAPGGVPRPRHLGRTLVRPHPGRHPPGGGPGGDCGGGSDRGRAQSRPGLRGGGFGEPGSLQPPPGPGGAPWPALRRAAVGGGGRLQGADRFLAQPLAGCAHPALPGAQGAQHPRVPVAPALRRTVAAVQPAARGRGGGAGLGGRRRAPPLPGRPQLQGGGKPGRGGRLADHAAPAPGPLDVERQPAEHQLHRKRHAQLPLQHGARRPLAAADRSGRPLARLCPGRGRGGFPAHPGMA